MLSATQITSPGCSWNSGMPGISSMSRKRTWKPVNKLSCGPCIKGIRSRAAQLCCPSNMLLLSIKSPRPLARESDFHDIVSNNERRGGQGEARAIWQKFLNVCTWLFFAIPSALYVIQSELEVKRELPVAFRQSRHISMWYIHPVQAGSGAGFHSGDSPRKHTSHVWLCLVSDGYDAMPRLNVVPTLSHYSAPGQQLRFKLVEGPTEACQSLGFMFPLSADRDIFVNDYTFPESLTDYRWIAIPYVQNGPMGLQSIALWFYGCIVYLSWGKCCTDRRHCWQNTPRISEICQLQNVGALDKRQQDMGVLQ